MMFKCRVGYSDRSCNQLIVPEVRKYMDDGSASALLAICAPFDWARSVVRQGLSCGQFDIFITRISVKVVICLQGT